MEFNKVNRFTNGQISVLADDILLFKYDSKATIEESDIIESQELRKKLIGNKNYYPIIDFSEGFVVFSKDAKKWVAENPESSSVRIMDVLLVNSWALRIEAKLYLKFFKPINPTHIAVSLPDALSIIERHKNSLKIKN